MNKKVLYSKAYRLLNNSTPLKIDCGTLCKKACCRGDDNTGMYVFPGEEVILERAHDFLKIKPSDFFSESGTRVSLAVCKGYCNRNLRPLGCRIFPLTPYISKNNSLIIRIDPRAKVLCPIAQYSDHEKVNRRFVRKVRKVFQLLIQDKEIKDFVTNLSRMFDEYYKLLPD